MKTFIKIFLPVMLVLLTSVQIFSQKSAIDFNNYKIGKDYKVLLYNGWNTEGRLVDIDSNTIRIKTDLKTFKINKTDIDQIVEIDYYFEIYDYSTDSLFKMESRTFYFLGSGITFTNVNSGNNISSGINIQAGIGKLLSPGSGIRGVFQFAQNTRNSNNSYSNNIEGGNYNNYSLTCDYMFGKLNPNSNLNIYGIFGGGFGVEHQTKIKYSSSYGYEYESKGYSFKKIILEAGAGIGYRVSKKAMIFSEFMYGFPVLYLEEGAEFNPYQSISYGQSNLKIGLMMDM